MMRYIVKERIMKAWTFFRRGHGVYLVFFMSFLNFLVIQWRLLIEKVDRIEVLFGRFTVFAVSFIVIYIPVAVLIGWFDYRKGSVKVDLDESAKANPFNRDIANALMCISESRPEEAKKYLVKWL